MADRSSLKIVGFIFATITLAHGETKSFDTNGAKRLQCIGFTSTSRFPYKL